MPDWMKPWHPPGLDSVRQTLAKATEGIPHLDSLPPLSAADEAQRKARQEQNQFEAVERAREEGRQEVFNQDQFTQGFDAGQEALKRQRAQQRAASSAKRKVTGARTTFRKPARKAFRSSSSVARTTQRSMGSAFKRRK